MIFVKLVFFRTDFTHHFKAMPKPPSQIANKQT